MKHLRPLRILCLIIAIIAGFSTGASAQLQIMNPGYSIGTSSGKLSFSYNQIPDPLVELNPPGISIFGFTYSWESSPDPLFSQINVVGTSSTYTFTAPLTQTTWFRRKATSNGLGLSAYSSTIKLNLVSANWEDLNYIREHDVNTIGVTDWKAVDQLSIGQKLQITTYVDGLGRTIEKVGREEAAPSQANGTWGDIVEFDQYDPLGREPVKYLAYSTTTESGKFKSAPQTEQPQYYSTVYNETSAFNTVSYDQSPLNRVTGLKEAGSKWALASANSASYEVNTTLDNVQIWIVDYTQGNAPVNRGAYPAGSLVKITMTDVNGSRVVQYTDKSGSLILKKIQIDNPASEAHAGWICTYNVYDDYGLLRYQIQPEGVKYLDAHGWSFAGTDGATILNEQCFQYNYDDKGRSIWKKSPGAAPINMLYDLRDRLVFSQDGNQAAQITPQWTTFLYDELDRQVETVLYNTNETITSLQTDINNAVSTTSYNFPAHTAPTQADVTYDNRNTSISHYVASNSISFVADAMGNFQTPDNDNFVADIDILPSYPAYSGTSITLGNPISPANLANTSVCTPVKYFYYDNYNFAGAKSFDNNFTNLSAYSNSDPNVMPILRSQRTLNFVTGNSVRVLGTNVFLQTTAFYDEKGRQIQTLKDNVKSGVDIVTSQYHFDGRTLSDCLSHTASGTGYTAFITLTKFLFDKLGRIASIQKQLGSNAFKTVATYERDDMGRLKTKHLDPEYNNPNLGRADLESLNYSYNIHNQIVGINKDYALKTSGSYDKWGHFFGLLIGYDQQSGVFNTSQLNGKVGGLLWSTQGDDAQRKYDFSYDNAGRLINALFTEQQHPGDGFNNTKSDFSVSGVSGQITYDLNGNILTMLQKGVQPGISSPITVDDLRYTYGAYSNKLQSVTDQMTTPAVNGLSGDFKDGSNAAGTPDYVYDANGNVVVDLNKNAQSLNNGPAGSNGISYNFLDKPEQIRIVGKGTIRIVYNADGERVQRAFIPESGAASTVTTYIEGFVYHETATLTPSSATPFSGTGVSLSYIDFEEGRIRVITPVSQPGNDMLQISGNLNLPNGKMGVWDYLVRDYQNNVRLVLTEETHTAGNVCTMETERSTTEDAIFGQSGAGNEVESSRFNTPTGWTTQNTSSSVTRLGNLAGHNIGPNTLQKVMAGDIITASAQYYLEGSYTSDNPNIIPNVLNSLAAALGGSATSGTIIHGSATPITNQLSNTPGFINAVEPNNNTTGTPQAYLTVLFFDERFNFISSADGGIYQQQVTSPWSANNSTLGLPNIKAPKNGYVYVYVSNRSDQHVYFDNLTVSISAGNIIEEDHYYAYGLKIAGISSKKLGDVAEADLKNNYLYNNQELLDDGDIDWYDYGFRNYDPQIGRFAQMDPFTDILASVSSFHYGFDDPITFSDANGLVGIYCPGTSAFTIFLDKVGTAITNGLTAVSPAITYISLGVNITNTAMHVEQVIANNQIINMSITARQAGEDDLDDIYRRGMADAIANANSLGLTDFLHHIFKGDPLNRYDNDEKRQAYLDGRRAGDIFILAQATLEVEGGTTIAGGGLATGPGAIFISTGGLAVALHGAGAGTVATADLAWLTARAIKYGLILKAVSDNPFKKQPEQRKDPPKQDPKKVERKEVVESKEAQKVYDKMDANQKKKVDEAVNLIQNKQAGGNQHVLTKERAGWKAIDLKGSGKGRGGVRVVYEETPNQIIIHEIVDYH